MNRDPTALNITTLGDRELVVSRQFDAPRRLVWRAWTTPELIQRWMLGPPGWTMPVCRMDLRPGGAWRFVWRRAEGTEMALHGEYREVQPPERLVSTENWGGDWPETVNTLTLAEKDGKTTATLTILYPSRQAREAAMKTGMDDGMAASFDRLEALLGTLGERPR